MQALEHGVSQEGPNQRNLLQVSGLKITINMTNQSNERIIAVQTLCQQCTIPVYEDLDLLKYYRVVTQSYLANGGFGFSWFKLYGRNRK